MAVNKNVRQSKASLMFGSDLRMKLVHTVRRFVGIVFMEALEFVVEFIHIFIGQIFKIYK